MIIQFQKIWEKADKIGQKTKKFTEIVEFIKRTKRTFYKERNTVSDIRNSMDEFNSKLRTV